MMPHSEAHSENTSSTPSQTIAQTPSQTSVQSSNRATEQANAAFAAQTTGQGGKNAEAAATAFTEKEKKAMFLNVVVGIVLLEFAVTVGAVVYSITNADRSAAGMLQFNFPWLGYLLSVTMVPVLVMLILHLVSLGFSRTLGQEASGPAVEALEGTRAGTFFALVRGAPTVILFAGFVLMGAAVYYLDGVMALLLKLGDSFQVVAVWLVAALGAAFCVNAVARAVLTYKTRKLEAEYAFRREIFERTGTILMSSEQVALQPGAGMAMSGQREITVQPVVLEITDAAHARGYAAPENDTAGSSVSAEKPEAVTVEVLSAKSRDL